jgi:multiple sugar transport system permease protein
MRPTARPRTSGAVRRRRRLLGPAIRRLVAAAVAFVFVAPFIWVLFTSLDHTSDVYRFPPSLLPHWVWSNYTRAWDAAPWGRLFLNTIFIAAATVALALLTSLLAGFAFGVMRFRGRNVLFGLVMSLLMIPPTVLIIPDYVIAKDIHWLDTYWIQIVPWGASVFGIFLIRQFFATLPDEIFDAAELDGAGRLRMLWSIGVPMVRPAVLIVALEVFMGSWNAFVWPFIMTNSTSVQPIEVGVATFFGANGTDWTGLSAVVVFTTLPVLVFFLVLQRYFVVSASSAAGGVRG